MKQYQRRIVKRIRINAALICSTMCSVKSPGTYIHTLVNTFFTTMEGPKSGSPKMVYGGKMEGKIDERHLN